MMNDRRILVVDDEEGVVKLIQRILTKEGYSVYIAMDGVEASRLGDAVSFDLVITDILMPEKDGLELVREFHKKFPEIRIIAMSGGGHIDAKDYLHIANKFGAAKLLQKPFVPSDLIDMVREIFQ